MKFYTSAHRHTHTWKNSHIYHFVYLSNEGGMQWQMFHSCQTLTLQQFRTGSQGHSIQEGLQGESREVKSNPANWDSVNTWSTLHIIASSLSPRDWMEKNGRHPSIAERPRFPGEEIETRKDP